MWFCHPQWYWVVRGLKRSQRHLDKKSVSFLQPVQPPTSERYARTAHLLLFVTGNYIPLKNNILLCLAILSRVQRCCSKGGLFWVTQPWPQPHLPFVIKCMRHDRSTLEFCLMTPLLKGLTFHLPGSPDVFFLKVPSILFEHTDG